MGVVTIIASCNLPNEPPKKMKGLKKFCKRMGIASRGGSNATNNLPPLLFNQVHGDNIRISRDGAIARRAESFCKAVAFSARPVKINEKVCIRFVEVSNNWSGVIRFGFTNNDPVNLRSAMPKYACPDLTNKPGYWAKALAERFAEKDAVLFYYVTQTGDVHFGINGEEKGIFFSGVDTRSPLWVLLDVYGNSTVVEFLDSRHQLNNSRRQDGSSGSMDHSDRLILPSMSSLSLRQPLTEESPVVVPPIRQSSQRYTPLTLHRTRGRNVCLSNDRCVAWRSEVEFCNGYVFTSRPICLGEKITIQVLNTDTSYVSGFAFGLTSCDPASMRLSDLPDDADLLLDRPEYWVVTKDVASSPSRGDELSFSIASNGEVRFSKNGSVPTPFMYVDHTLQLWGFIDLYGTTQKIRLLGTTLETGEAAGPVFHPIRTDSSASDTPRLQVTLPASPVSHPPTPSPSHHPTPSTSRAMSAASLVVSLPPSNLQYPASPQARGSVDVVVASGSGLTVSLPPPSTSGTMTSTYSHTYVEPVTGPTAYSTVSSWEGLGNECSICYERPVDSVLYMCGHMCMCYSCAVQQWRGKGGGQCPICRAMIRDVIRTFKS